MYHGAVKYAAQIARLRITYARTATLLPHSGCSRPKQRGGAGHRARCGPDACLDAGVTTHRPTPAGASDSGGVDAGGAGFGSRR